MYFRVKCIDICEISVLLLSSVDSLILKCALGGEGEAGGEVGRVPKSIP